MTATDTETRCERHDMVAAWCAICRGTDRPVVFLDEHGHPLGIGALYNARAGEVTPRWHRTAALPLCDGCGERVDGELVWSPHYGGRVGECCASAS